MSTHSRKSSKAVGTFGHVSQSFTFIRRVSIEVRSRNFLGFQHPNSDIYISLNCDISEVIDGMVRNNTYIATIDHDAKCIIDRNGRPIEAINSQEIYELICKRIRGCKFIEY